MSESGHDRQADQPTEDPAGQGHFGGCGRGGAFQEDSPQGRECQSQHTEPDDAGDLRRVPFSWSFFTPEQKGSSGYGNAGPEEARQGGELVEKKPAKGKCQGGSEGVEGAEDGEVRGAESSDHREVPEGIKNTA